MLLDQQLAIIRRGAEEILLEAELVDRLKKTSHTFDPILLK